jgi:hypothetical protein
VRLRRMVGPPAWIVVRGEAGVQPV